MALALAVPAFAIEESEVEAAVNATSREEVTGNVLIWFLCAVAFLKVSQKIDSFMSSIGVNVGHTGGSMLAEAMVAARGISVATGATGKVIGGFGKGGSGAKGERGSAGFSGIFHGGLAGMVSRKVTNDAVKTATNTTEKAASSSSRETQAASAVHTATHAATATQTVGATSKSATSHTATAQRSDSAGRTERTSESTRHQSTSGHTQTASAVHRSSQQTSLGGKLFMSSMLTGGQFANEVIGKVVTGDIRSTGTISGDFAAQALSCYTGLAAQGDTAPQVSYADVEIGGGRITGTEYTPEHPEGISFGLYHVDQYTKPDGDFQKIFTADGAQWYKQYAVDTVIKTPFKAPDGEVDYHKEIVKRLPDPPKRKDRI